MGSEPIGKGRPIPHLPTASQPAKTKPFSRQRVRQTCIFAIALKSTSRLGLGLAKPAGEVSIPVPATAESPAGNSRALLCLL